MATTPNYSWVMPDSTDLVKDLPADFATFGNAVDATVYSNASAGIAKTLIDAKGDLIVGSAADTAARLAVGTNGYALIADSTASTGLAYKNLVPDQTSNSGKYLTTDGTNTSWGTISAGGMTLLASGNLSGSGMSLSGIPSGYSNLQLFMRNMSAASASQILMTINGVTGGSNYSGGTITSAFTERISAGFFTINGQLNIASNAYMVVNFYDYLNQHSGTAHYVTTASAATNNRSFAWFSDTNQNAITSFNIYVAGANWTAGTYALYGVK